MSSYYCIVNLPGVPARDIAALAAQNDDAATAAMTRVADCWPGFETVALYDGERTVSVLANASLGFPLDAPAIEESVA